MTEGELVKAVLGQVVLRVVLFDYHDFYKFVLLDPKIPLSG